MFLFILQTGCKKTDLQPVENPQVSVDIRSFFSESKAIPDQVVRVMEELKIRSENSRLVGDISKRYGSALWEKSMIKMPVIERGGTATIFKNQKGNNDTLVIIIPFDNADALWTSFQNKINDFVNHPQQQGISSISTPQIHRPSWSKVKAVMNGNAPLSNLSKDCP